MIENESLTKIRRRFLEYYKQDDTNNAILWGERLIRFQKTGRKTCTMDYADDSFNLGRVYEAAQRYEKAVSLYTISAGAIRRGFGESPALAKRLNNLAAAHSRMGNYEVARRFLREARDILESHMCKESQDYAAVMYNLANHYADMENYDYALKLHFELLPGLKKTETAYVDSLNSICYIYEEKKDWSNAILYAEKAVSALKKNNPRDMIEICKNIYYLADLYERDGKLEKSLKLFEAASIWMDKNLGVEHPYAIGCVNRMAEVLHKMGEDDASLSLRLRALSLIKQTAGESHIYYANLLRGIGVLYKEKENRALAEEMLLECIEIKRMLIGNDGYDHVNDMILLIGYYIEWEELQKAVDLLVYTLENIHVENGGFESFMVELAKIYLRLEEHDEISRLYQKVAEICANDDWKAILSEMKNEK